MKVQCCPHINLASDLQPGLGGDYEKVGDFNGHTFYQVENNYDKLLLTSSFSQVVSM